jgi:hypothetical protein
VLALRAAFVFVTFSHRRAVAFFFEPSPHAVIRSVLKEECGDEEPVGIISGQHLKAKVDETLSR